MRVSYMPEAMEWNADIACAIGLVSERVMSHAITSARPRNNPMIPRTTPRRAAAFAIAVGCGLLLSWGCGKRPDVQSSDATKLKVAYLGLTCEAPIFVAREKDDVLSDTGSRPGFAHDRVRGANRGSQQCEQRHDNADESLQITDFHRGT